MKLENKLAIIRILNKNYKGDMIIPAYNHIEIDGKIYALKNKNLPKLQGSGPYLEKKIIVSGLTSEELGHMPNPMTNCSVFTIESIN